MSEKTPREWQVGDKVAVFNADSKFECVAEIKKIYKNGNFIIEFRNYLNEAYTRQFRGGGTGHYARETGDGWTHYHVEFMTPEVEEKVRVAKERRNRNKLQLEIHKRMGQGQRLLTLGQLERMKEILDEQGE